MERGEYKRLEDKGKRFFDLFLFGIFSKDGLIDLPRHRAVMKQSSCQLAGYNFK